MNRNPIKRISYQIERLNSKPLNAGLVARGCGIFLVV